MTVAGTARKTAVLFAVLLLAAVAGWVCVAEALPVTDVLLIGAPLVGFALAMVIIFTSRRKVRPWLIVMYAAAEGLALGALSALFQVAYPGVVLQAVLATLCVFAVVLALFASGKLRATGKLTKFFLIAMVGFIVYSLVNVALMMTGVLSANLAFGLDSVTFLGIPLGIIIGVFVVLLACYSLVLDFDSIQRGVAAGAPVPYEWYGAFGLMVTIVWLYLEILRILALAQGKR